MPNRQWEILLGQYSSDNLQETYKTVVKKALQHYFLAGAAQNNHMPPSRLLIYCNDILNLISTLQQSMALNYFFTT